MKALVAMSGGVDSSVAAALMLDQGYDVVGVTLKQWEGADGQMPLAGCCTVSDAEDATAGGRPARCSLLRARLCRRVHREGRRPLSVRCMPQARLRTPVSSAIVRVRFSVLLERTQALGCDVLVTGSSRPDPSRCRPAITSSRPSTAPRTSRTYCTCWARRILARVRLPIGEMTKAEGSGVRRRNGSADCGQTRQPGPLLSSAMARTATSSAARFPEAARPGPLVTSDGTELAGHDGMVDFTIGQRKGLGVALGERRYVVGIDRGDGDRDAGDEG